ncbi:MAG: hypothetical protein IJB90_02665 [Clostridia bacterium]|nr:hypothetical protein [Clostridia bacterium]
MDKKKLLIIILVLVLLVVSAVLLTIKLFNLENETVKTSTENVIENYAVNNTIQNEVSNNVVNNTVQNNVNNVVQNETNNTTTNTKQEETKEDTQTNEEKAVAIVEKIWKNEKNVYCSFEEIDSEGKYIVRVTKETRVLCWYAIDIETGKYSVKQNI